MANLRSHRSIHESNCCGARILGVIESGKFICEKCGNPDDMVSFEIPEDEYAKMQIDQAIFLHKIGVPIEKLFTH